MGCRFPIFANCTMPNVWIIEDNDQFREVTRRGVEAFAADCNASAFNHCEAAIDQIESGSTPDLVLMDIGLPGMDGIQGIGEIKRRVPETPILILTVFEDDDKIFRAIQAGASGYLLKSEKIAKICESVEMTLQGSTPIHPRIAGKILKMFAELSPAKSEHRLNEREVAVLECMAKGYVRKEMAQELELNMHTVDYTVRRVYAKLHVNGPAAAVAMAIRERIIDPPQEMPG